MLTTQACISNISTYYQAGYYILLKRVTIHPTNIHLIRWIYCNALLLNPQNTNKLYDYVPQQWHYQGDMQSELANTRPTLMVNLLSNYL